MIGDHRPRRRRRAGWIVPALALVLGRAPAQTFEVPVGAELLVETSAPIDATRDDAGKRFAAVLAADLVVEFMRVAADGDVCTGRVTRAPTGELTLEITRIRTAFGERAVVAAAPRFGEERASPPQAVGFAGALAASTETGPGRAGGSVAAAEGPLSVPGGAALTFRVAEAWTLPLHEALSVFPQPEGAEPDSEPRPVPMGWFAQTATQPQQPRRGQGGVRVQRGGRSRRGRWDGGIDGYRRGGRVVGGQPPPTGFPSWHSSHNGSGTANPWPGATAQPMTPAQRKAMGIEPATFPAGTVLVARTSEPIDSSLVAPGAPFASTLMIDLVADGRVVVNRGSRARGIVTVGKVGEDFLPTLALTAVQLGGTSVAIQTGAVRILHVPARRAEPAAVGVGAVTAAADVHVDSEQREEWNDDGALRLQEGTILGFALAKPLTVR